MKYLFSLLALLLLASGCSPYAGYVNLDDEDGKVVMGSAGGSVEPERYIGLERQQNKSEALAELYRQHKSAVAKGNLQRADSLQYLIDRMNFAGSGFNTGVATSEYVMLKFRNATEHGIQVLTGPFAGLRLNPREESRYAARVPVGPVVIQYKVYWNNAGHASSRRTNFFVSKNDKTPLTLTGK